MKSVSAAVAFLASAAFVLCACQPSSETPKTRQAPAVKKEEPLFAVVDGNKVDAKTLEGWRTWRAMACERCHGAKQEGLVGPSLVEGLKRLNKDEFKKTVLEGRPEKGMPNFNTSKQVVDNIDNLYAYLKGRSDNAIQAGRLQPIAQ